MPGKSCACQPQIEGPAAGAVGGLWADEHAGGLLYFQNYNLKMAIYQIPTEGLGVSGC